MLSVADDEWRSSSSSGSTLASASATSPPSSGRKLTWPRRDPAHGRQDQQAAPFRSPLHCASTSHWPAAMMIPALPSTHEPQLLAACHGRVAMLSQAFGELLVSAGLREPSGAGEGQGHRPLGRRAGFALSFHSLRHTAVSLMKDAGVPDAVVMALVGHDSKAMCGTTRTSARKRWRKLRGHCQRSERPSPTWRVSLIGPPVMSEEIQGRRGPGCHLLRKQEKRKLAAPNAPLWIRNCPL